MMDSIKVLILATQGTTGFIGKGQVVDQNIATHLVGDVGRVQLLVVLSVLVWGEPEMGLKSWDPVSLEFGETAVHLWRDPLLLKISGSSPHHPLQNYWIHPVPVSVKTKKPMSCTVLQSRMQALLLSTNYMKKAYSFLLVRGVYGIEC